jgi:transaldolase
MSLKNINYTIWCDFIEREFLEKDFKNYINSGMIHGATSNPAIFEQAIIKSNAYMAQIKTLSNKTSKEIYEILAIQDIKRAAELLLPLYQKDNNDGFISLEVDPKLYNDALGTIEEGARLFETINMPNVMIKIPATEAGYMAMRELTKMGVNVNATLIFSPQQAKECAQALHDGINQSKKATKGVVSVFVSRFDRIVDEKLPDNKKAKLGIVNATKCYHEVQKVKNDNIRILFASTGVKGDTLKANYYIDELAFANCVNTAPIGALNAWIENNDKKMAQSFSLEQCDEFIASMTNYGIDLNKLYDELLNDGLKSFVESFDNILQKLNQQ